MAKGMFTASACLLTNGPVSLNDVADRLNGFGISERVDAPAGHWSMGGPTVVVPYRKEVNGYVAVDVVSRKWPDTMGGDPRPDAKVFKAWAAGHFGPFAFPDGLDRAATQAHAWPDGKTAPDRHAGFIRLRTSYGFGSGDSVGAPPGYRAADELVFVTTLAAALFDVPGVVCYFNPNGEVLRGAESLAASLAEAAELAVPPLDVWSNVRVLRSNDDWIAMDCVGNAQLDLPDVEVCFARSRQDAQAMDPFIRDLSLYLLNNGDVIKDGDSIGGPGDVEWVCRHRDEGLFAPPRRTRRFFPLDGHEPPPILVERGSRPTEV